MRKIFFLLMVLFLIVCDKQKATEMELREERLSSFILRSYDGSKLKWKLTAEDAEISDTTVIHRLEVEFFDDKLQSSSKLEADSGYVFRKTNDLRVLGHIFIRSKDSVMLWTDELNWSEERQKIFTDGEVKYSKGNQIYKGRGLESDPDLKNIVIKEKFSGKVEFE
jgi:LPS export ABC transporter protein LptC